MAIVGAMGVGMTVSTASAADAPAPLPITPPSVEGSTQAPGLRHPAANIPKAAGTTSRTAKLAASAAPVDDFDGNGVSDLVYTNQYGEFFLNSDTRGEEIIGGSVDANLLITPGDMNNDGHADLITRRSNGELWLHAALYPGAPQLGSYNRIGTGWQIYNRVFGAGDLTGDGNPDLLARTPAGDLYLYKGHADGSLGVRVKIGWGWQGYDQLTVVRDLTGDGRPDVLARTPSGDLYVYKGLGNGKLGARTKIGYGWNAYNQIIAGGDYNGDGVSDVLARAYNGDLYVYSSNGKGGLGGRSKVASTWNLVRQFANTGGTSVYGKSYLFASKNTGIYGYAYNGKGGLFPRFVVSDSWAKELPIINSVSLTENAYSDLLTVDYDKNLYSMMDGSKLANWSGKTATVGPGDLTGDGKSDILARTSAGKLQLYPGRGNGTIGSPTTLGAGWNIYNSLVGAGDVSGDGRPDLFARTPAGDLFLYKGLGNGKFATRVKIGTGYGIYTKLAAPGDMNGDGYADLVASDKAGKLWLYTGKFGGALNKRVLIGTGGWNAYTSLS